MTVPVFFFHRLCSCLLEAGLYASLLFCYYIYRCVCVNCMCACVFCASNLLHECNRHLIAVFPHTLWLAPLTAFGNVCLLSLASLHLEHAPGKLPDLCAIRLVVISCASALLGPMRMVQLSVLCHREARAVISALDSPAITAVRLPSSHRRLTKETSVFSFCYSFHHVCMSSFKSSCVFLCFQWF